MHQDGEGIAFTPSPLGNNGLRIHVRKPHTMLDQLGIIPYTRTKTPQDNAPELAALEMAALETEWVASEWVRAVRLRTASRPHSPKAYSRGRRCAIPLPSKCCGNEVGHPTRQHQGVAGQTPCASRRPASMCTHVRRPQHRLDSGRPQGWSRNNPTADWDLDVCRRKIHRADFPAHPSTRRY